MDFKSQFVSRYKKDLSIENLRAKVARRKSISQKENRHKEFRKSRGLALVDANVSVEERDLPVLEEVNESLVCKGLAHKTAVPVNSGDKKSASRIAMLQRFQEEKQLRKLKEQREKANKGVFRCGLYKPDNPYVFAPTTQPPAKMKPKEKPALPVATRVTRSMVKMEAPVTNMKSQYSKVPGLKKVTEHMAQCGQTSVLKKNEKEKKVTAVPSARTTRATAATAATSRLLTAHGDLKHTSVVKPQKKTKDDLKQKIVSRKPEKTVQVKPELAIEEEVMPMVAIEEEVMPMVAIEEEVMPMVAIEEELKPEVAIVEEVMPVVTIVEEVKPKVATEEEVMPVVATEEEVKPVVAIEMTPVEKEIHAEKTSVQQERAPSFAPKNFVFQPMAGLSIFNFQPMTPKRANAFLTPTFTWSPVNGKSNFVFTRAHSEEKILHVSPPDLPMNVELEMDTYVSPEVKDVAVTLPVRQESPPVCDPKECTPTDNPAQSDETCHDVPYFRGLLKSEIQKLTLLSSEWDKKLGTDIPIPEDAKDLIRTTVGQTRLLIKERFKQFEGLVDNCEFKLGEKETTCTDLDGFWDMIYFQIEDVNKKFVNLGKLEENSWQQTIVQAKRVVRKKAVPAATVNKSQAENGRVAARSRLAAIKAAMRNKVKQEEVVEEPLVSEQPMLVDPIVFDAGFFRIESPAKVTASQRRKTYSQISGTPKSTNKFLQKSDYPASDCTEGGADHTQVQKSPSADKSPVRKALFAAQEESFQNRQEDPVVTNPESAESAIVPQVVDLTRYMDHTTAITDTVAGSSEFMECSRLEKETKLGVAGTAVDDVYMCSPEKVQETKNISPKNETIEILPDEGLRTKTPFQTSATPKSTIKILQNSDNPASYSTEDGADHTHVQKSPSPDKSPVRKALFATDEASFQNHQEDHMVTNPENTESGILPQVADMTKYLVHTISATDSVADSPGFMECSVLKSRGTDLEEETTCDVTGTAVDDLFMCSPEKALETKIPSPKDGTTEVLLDEDLKNSDNLLDFIGSCTPNMGRHTPVMFESVIAESDLMVFSPMES